MLTDTAVAFGIAYVGPVESVLVDQIVRRCASGFRDRPHTRLPVDRAGQQEGRRHGGSDGPAPPTVPQNAGM